MSDEGATEWEYRIVRYDFPDGRSRFQLSEVYLKSDGTPEWCTPHDPIEAWSEGGSDPLDMLREEWLQLADAFLKPIIDAATLRTAEEVIGELLEEAGIKV